ncbi:MAG: hypothetical protein M1823_008443, partial [Watsoniomyces obsoletus]
HRPGRDHGYPATHAGPPRPAHAAGESGRHRIGSGEAHRAKRAEPPRCSHASCRRYECRPDGSTAGSGSGGPDRNCALHTRRAIRLASDHRRCADAGRPVPRRLCSICSARHRRRCHVRHLGSDSASLCHLCICWRRLHWAGHGSHRRRLRNGEQTGLALDRLAYSHSYWPVWCH